MQPAALGRAGGILSSGEHHPNQVLHTFSSIEARYSVERTHLKLAEFAYTQGNGEATVTPIKRTYRLFRALRIPKHAERTERVSAVPGDGYFPSGSDHRLS